MSDYDRSQWQAEQTARDAALEKEREKHRKARERSARNVARKLERLHRTLKESGDITDFEDEFSESVSERLEEFGSAFHDLEKGRPGDALSFAQKKVLSAMNRKVKDAKKAKQTPAEDDERAPRSSFKSRGSGFGRKNKDGWKPRVRQLDEEWEDEQAPVSQKALKAVREPGAEPAPERPLVGKPFLRTLDSGDTPPPAAKRKAGPQPVARPVLRTVDKLEDAPPAPPPEPEAEPDRPPVGRPFLRLISDDDAFDDED